jgi:hypothetical protein
VTANALVVIAAFHAAAALLHHWVFGDRTLTRMLPPGFAPIAHKFSSAADMVRCSEPAAGTERRGQMP